VIFSQLQGIYWRGLPLADAMGTVLLFSRQTAKVTLMKIQFVIPLLMVIAMKNASSLMLAADPPLPVVSQVDLVKYAGKWHEIARLPNWFQKKCAGEVTANYTLKPNGKVEVINRCRQADGTYTTAKGTAKVADKATNAKLKVTFFWPFYGDYWILDLGPNYEYVMVGEPKRKYLWLLSRTPVMDATLYEQLLAKARSLGYDTSPMIRTAQAGSTTSNEKRGSQVP
jgi:apolipoprotein D and lipocalin family protein